MPLSAGDRLGPYEVTGELGAGGMGIVLRATDTQLNRDVALKILPDAFAADPDRLARFQREAQVLASLNHPNIAQIHGIEEADGTRALVLELVEGPTLADRIAEGSIPLDDALAIATQIAEALEAAHESGVIHRDLKPANIKVRDDGTVKVLDFGLAKALDPSPDGDPSQSPTLTAAATRMGVIMGTAAYMAPEQAKGKVADKRADVWAFGCVLYEMLTGRRTFEGDDISEVMAGVIKSEPEWDALPAELPPAVVTYLRRCLQKDPRERLRDIGDVRLAMAGAFDVPAPPAVELPEPSAAVPQLQRWQRPGAVSLVALAAAVLAGVGVWTLTRPDVMPAGLVRFTIVPPDTAPLGFSPGLRDVAISPDGTQVIYNGPAPGGANSQLNLRPIDQLVGAPLRGGEGGLGPFVSPDGEWVGFVPFRRVTTLQKVSIFGGPPVTVTESPEVIRGASWGTDDQIIFGTDGTGLLRVPGGGGEPETLTTLDTAQAETDHGWPFIIPGREAVVFVISSGSTQTTGQLAVLDLDTREVTRLGLAGVSPHYVSTGHLVYGAEDGSVRAVPFDATSLEVTGNPVPLVEGITVKSSGAADFSISDDGRLVYALGAGGGGPQRSFAWVDRDGREEPVDAEPRNYQEFTVSPDGSRVAVRVIGDKPDVWVYDMARNTSTRLTFEAGNDRFPTWTPDGTRLAFGAPLSLKLANGTGEIEALADSASQFPHAFSPDGTVLVFEDRNAGQDVGMLALDGDRTPTLLLQDEWIERNPSLSPDGRWLAYESDESGQTEVYVRPFPDIDGGRWQVSTGIGRWPIWNPVANELFFIDSHRLVALAFEAEPTFTLGAVTELFDMAPYHTAQFARRVGVSPDGERFLLLKNRTDRTDGEEGAPPQITVVLNWFEELNQRVPVN